MSDPQFKGSYLPHQIRAIEKIRNSDGVLLYHGLGSGKTISAIGGAGDDFVAVTPASLRENFKKEIGKFKGVKKYRVSSYNKPFDGTEKDKNTLILDEVQRIGRTSSQMSHDVVGNSSGFNKRILLSATPINNHPSELAPIIRILNPESNIPLNSYDFNKIFLKTDRVKVPIFKKIFGASDGVKYSIKNKDLLKNVLSGKVDYQPSSTDNFPERKDRVVEVEASPEQNKYYKYVTSQADPLIAMKVRSNLPLSKKELSKINAFMTAARQVSNTTAPYGGREVRSNKLNKIVDDFSEMVNKNKDHKGLIYSNYIGAGLDEIYKGLREKGLKPVKFTGDMNDKQKRKAVDDYNKGNYQAILVSSSGSEGLDLKGTRSIQITEPHWNKSRIEQVIGRGVRFKSHEHLPEDQRSVEVIKYHTVLPKTIIQRLVNKRSSMSSDQYLENLSNEKQKLIDEFLDVLKEEGMSKSSSLLPRFYNISFISTLTKLAWL